MDEQVPGAVTDAPSKDQEHEGLGQGRDNPGPVPQETQKPQGGKMNLLSKLFGGKGLAKSAPTEPDIVQLRANGDFALEVVGESHYQHYLETICGPRTEEGENRIVEAHLILEDSNPHDSKAVRVEISELQVGHLRREVARLYREQLRQKGHPHAIGRCAARVKGGWKRKGDGTGYYGVWLDIPIEEID